VIPLAQLLGFALLLGLDSLRASAGLASAGLAGERPLRLALAFGVCEAAAPIVGVATGRSVLHRLDGVADYVGPVVLITCAVCVLSAENPTRLLKRRDWALVAGLPLILGLDNLVAGAALGVYGVPVLAAALVLGAVSCVLALVGLAIGRTIASRLEPRLEFAGPAVLVLIAVSLATKPL
jgi:putative Mn2+ efflux pump MntP